MNVSITPELEKFVQSKVSSGMYQSASEVIREALRLLAERDEVRQKRVKELDEMIQVGLDQIARGEVHTEAEVKAHMQAYKEEFFKKRNAEK